jgi:hypothetical protein
MGRFAEHGRAAAPGAIALVLASQAYAFVIETEVRLRGLDRRLSITVDEPGTANQLLLKVSGVDEAFAIDSYDRRTGGLTAMREVEVGGQKKIEIVALFAEPALLDSFKKDPVTAARRMAFVNASEVTCPGESTHVLMYRQRLSRPTSMGNCLQTGSPAWTQVPTTP